MQVCVEVLNLGGENNRVEKRVCGIDLASATVCVKGPFP